MINLFGQGFANVLNFLTLGVLCKYAYDTNRLASHSQSQSRAAVESLEAACRPCIIVDSNQKGGVGDIGIQATLKLVNIGSGPALNISWRFEKQTRPMLANSLVPAAELQLEIQPKDLYHGGNRITCDYESLGGFRYRSETKLILDEGRLSFHLEHSFTKV